MAQQTLNNLESAQIFRTKANQNFTELHTEKAPINHSSGSMEYGIASASMYGHIKITPANGLVINDGVLSINSASTSVAGTVQLVDNLTTNDATKALTAAQGKILKDTAVVTHYGTTVPSAGLGKNGDIYFKTV